VLYYNADWLAELGYSNPPATPEDFKQMACAATPSFDTSTVGESLGYQFYLDSTRFSSWVYAFGGDFFDEETNKFTYDSQINVQAVNFLLDLIQTGCASTGFQRDEVQTAFIEGKTLLMIDSSFHVPAIEMMVNERGDFEWNVAPMPTTQDEPVQNVFGASASIPTSTPQKELAAWVFLKYFTSPEVQAQWSQGSNYLPVRRSAGDYLVDYFSNHPQSRVAFDVLNYGITEPSIPGYDFIGQEVELALEAILEGGDVAAILNSLNITANQILTDHVER
jgi:multiple sugar transport system substrate-binding protein/sn-glycerol 3-phosphate transport system substrate-binding protein